MPEWISKAYIETGILAALAFAAPVLIGYILSLCFKAVGRGPRVKNNRVYRLLASSINIIALIIGLISFLGTLGVNVSALIAGLGLSGLALGLALKDAISNFIAGLMIILYSPFDLGDELETAGEVGRVVDMDLRYVTIETEDEWILIPNNSFLTSVVKRKKPVGENSE